MSRRGATRHKDKEETRLLPHRLSDLKALGCANGTNISGRNGIFSNFCDSLCFVHGLFISQNDPCLYLKKNSFFQAQCIS